MTANQIVSLHPNLTVKGLMLFLSIPQSKHDHAKRLLAAAKAWNAAPMERRLEGTHKIAADTVRMTVQTVATSRNFQKHVRRYTPAEIDQHALVQRTAPQMKLEIRDHTTLLDGQESVTVQPCVLGKQQPDGRVRFLCNHEGVYGEWVARSRSEQGQRSAAA